MKLACLTSVWPVRAPLSPPPSPAPSETSTVGQRCDLIPSSDSQAHPWYVLPHLPAHPHTQLWSPQAEGRARSFRPLIRSRADGFLSLSSLSGSFLSFSRVSFLSFLFSLFSVFSLFPYPSVFYFFSLSSLRLSLFEFSFRSSYFLLLSLLSRALGLLLSLTLSSLFLTAGLDAPAVICRRG